MNARLLRRAGLLLAGSTIIAIVGAVALLRMARPKPWFTYSRSPLSQADYDALTARPGGWTQSVVEMRDGVKLTGLVSPPARPDAAWVLFFPGNDATQLARGQLLLERIRGQRAWGLAVYASRGYDASGGTPNPRDFAEDAKRVYGAVLSENRLRPSQVHLVAFSLGGYSALHVLRDLGQQGQKPASLSLLASVARVAMVPNDFWSRFRTGDIYDVMPILSTTPGPVLVIEGGADEAFAGWPQGKMLIQGLAERGRYLELPGVGHNAILESEAAISAVRAMIEANSSP